MSIHEPHVAFGNARAAVDNFETTLARALAQASDAANKINAIPGVSMNPDLAARLRSFREAGSALNLSAYLENEVRPAFKAAA